MSLEKQKVMKQCKDRLYNMRIFIQMKAKFEHYLALHDSVLYLFNEDCLNHTKDVDKVRELATKLKWDFKDDISVESVPHFKKLEEIRQNVFKFLKLADDFEAMIKKVVMERTSDKSS